MKSRIFMYLFFFALLFIIFQYMNEKSIFESQENKINSLTEKVTVYQDSIEVLNDRVADLNYFTLQGNDNAMTYLENLGLESDSVQTITSEMIYDKNLEKGGNPLIPYEGMEGELRVNKIKFLNHRWILADFSDGTYWGEMILEYFYNENLDLEITPVASVLYPN